MAGFFNIAVSSTVNLADLDRRLLEAQRRVLKRWEKKLLKRIKGRWVNWKYAGRPENAPINVSLQAWKSRIELDPEGRPTLVILNEARDYRYGKPYVAHVHRAGRTTPEVDVIGDDIDASVVPAMRQDLVKEIRKTLAAPQRRRRIGTRGGGPTRTLKLEV